jgi:cysteine desulfurase
MTNRKIYLDHGATTPVHPQVLESMLPYWTERYGNPSSSHSFGRQAESGLRSARETISNLLNASSKEIVFTANGSASDNLAIRGVVKSKQPTNKANHIIISSIEHSAVTKTAVQLSHFNECELTILPVDDFGRIQLPDLQAAIQPNTILISIMAANNEIGTLQPIEDIGKIAREHNVLFHTDAIQAMAIRQWNMAEMPIDLLSIAPHKFYGPKGVGILFVREGIKLEPVLTGGGQEDNRRAGTENVAFAVGAAEALRLAMADQSDLLVHYRLLSGKLIEGLTTALPDDCVLTGHPTQRLPHNASFAFREVSGNDILMHLDLAGIAASSGSACKTGDPKPSSTLEAIGLSSEWAKGGLRLTVGRQNNLADIEYTLQTIPPIIRKLQELDSIWA